VRQYNRAGDTRTHFINSHECERGVPEAVRGVVAQHRLVPVQATQQSNAPGTSVPGGFAS
jgi:hypothetical protein